MINKIKEVYKDNKVLFIFLVSFFILMILGLCLSYNYDMKNNYNLLFDSDTGRVIRDAIEIGGEHYRINVHPLFVLLIQPLCFLLNGIFLNKMISIIFLSSLISSLSTVLIYKILDKINKNKINIILSFIYGLSFSNLIYTTGIETYNFAAFFLILLWYYFVNKEKELNKYSYIIIVLLGILSFAFTITNIIVFFIFLFCLFLSKKLSIKNGIIVVLCTLVLGISLNIGQKLIWNNTPFFWKTNMNEETTNYAEGKISLKNIKNVVENDYMNSLISSDISLKVKYSSEYNGQNYIIIFQKNDFVSIILLLSFYILLIILIVRNIKKNLILNIGLLLTLLFNTLLHIIYGNDGTFLYSLHFLYLIILLFGINLLKEENKTITKITNIFLPCFLSFEVIKNSFIFSKVLDYVRDNINKNYLVANIGEPFTILLEIGIICICFIGILLIINIYKKIKKVKLKEEKIIWITSIIGIIIGIELIFIMLNSIELQNKFLWIKLNNNSLETEAKTKKDYMSKSFQETYKEELNKLEEYQKEYQLFKNTYQPEQTKDANWFDYYYFGMANRRKIYFHTNQLIDIETKEVILEFDEKEHYIIPNLYTVLIETKNNEFIKIVEDSDGVHYISNKKEFIIDGTNTKINLYDFKDQTYSNIKKVLYGEILFNIKNSIIYPNIIVYDKPWYRDAAMVCMVLKQTNNTDLIKDWVNNITEIYDKQNKGIEEADNLGELLYILSTQEERNEDLIRRIEEEAEKIASSNEEGYFIKGKTDFGDQFLYQNLWYKLGIESVGRIFKFDLSSINEDLYSNMAWWSNYNINTKQHIESKEFPYLSYATRHKLDFGTIIVNENIYPLSWEITASEANYDNYRGLENEMIQGRISPLHSWAASEFLLWLLDETNDLNFK